MPLETDIERLSRVPLLSAMDHGALRLIAFAAETLRLAGGDRLFQRGDTADCGYLVVSGAIELLPSDDPETAARAVGPGTLIGEHALLAETLRPVGARASKPSSVLKIPRSLFARVLQEYPANAITIRRAWAQRLAARLAADQNRNSAVTGT